MHLVYFERADLTGSLPVMAAHVFVSLDARVFRALVC